ncbi:hydantoinase/oxoprolinase family protein [Ramlibacter sp. AW1]|uniref:Hydantoinase/oxoprolinase family protein n=1 Tax=Ramlibacter aurantiacus TaxID=2801330 RepID=A0A936ZKC2_9BURK|nr:hydantoinase/oxoprolinase family protein [Ramlibacter aurantiacus]MBL0419311.1 hydantoinase/oxoprolinase family protein [Ramlibacter aurantiacus]
MTTSSDIIIAIDIGGTFTDLVAYDAQGDRLVHTKSLTTYGDLAEGIFSCIEQLNLPLPRVRLLKHGTTLVINALIQRNGSRTGLLCTKGFRDVLEIARGNRPLPFELSYRRDPPLVSRDLRLEVDERIDARGEVVVPLREDDVLRAARALVERGAAAIAVSFLNAYANPDHEAQATRLLRREFPGLHVCAGTELSGEWHEYERTSTAAANASVGPLMADYLQHLESALSQRGCSEPVLMMSSNGGMLSAGNAARMPIGLVESGPVGGCIGAAELARALDIDRAIAFDMGGTTAKCAVIEHFAFNVESTYYIGGYERGFPIRAPVLDIVEVGTGGGSLAWADPQGRLHVGPRSAGSTPGPACYGRGGRIPTITDANLLLGRLNPDRFLGGQMKLDAEAAERALATGLGDPLGYQGQDRLCTLANGIVRIATQKMAEAIRQVSVARGKDPRDFVLIAYGGGGPLHAVELARELGLSRVVIPSEPGNFSAAGMLLADLRCDRRATLLRAVDEDGVRAAGDMLTGLQAAATAEMLADSRPAAVRGEWFCELRYVGQHHTIKVPFDREATSESLHQVFRDTYRQTFGHLNERSPIEFVGVAVVVIGEIPKPPMLGATRARARRRPVETRSVFSALLGGKVSASIVDRESIEPGTVVEGPALLEEYGSTTLLDMGDRAVVGAFGELMITCAPPRAVELPHER